MLRLQKLLIFIMLTAFSTASESQVIREGVIEYTTESKMGMDAFLKKPDFEGEDGPEILANWETSAARIRNKLREKINQENKDIVRIYFTDSLAHLEKSPPDMDTTFYLKSWHVFHFKEMKIFNYYFVTKSRKLKEIQVDFNKPYEVGSTDPKRFYTTKVDTSARKNILGFDCFYMVVEESWGNSAEDKTEKWKYEMWVTDKIGLPAHVSLDFWQPITGYCVLECRQISLSPKFEMSIIHRALRVAEQDVSEKLIMPDWAKK